MTNRSHPATVAELLQPRSVAVVGASEDQTKFGGRLFRMLLKHGYAGTVYPINPARASLFGIPTCASIEATPEPPDLVVMALPRDKVLPSIEAAARRGTRGAIVITAKFSDAGPEGAALERRLVEAARAHGMRLMGPNCLGVISPAHRVVLCSSPALDVEQLPVGRIGLVSQSGALMATVFDRAQGVGVGFSHAVSVGNQADLELCDFVEFLVDDPATGVICSYVEGLKDAPRFVQAARRARAAGKPWLMVKAGRTEAGSAAAFSHTASLAGSHAVFEAVCRDEGVTLLEDTGAMVTLAAAMARHPGRRVQRVAVLTTSGGGGALAADALSARAVELARFTPATRMRLDDFYPADQAANPVDLGGRKFDEAVNVGQATAAIVTEDEATDAVLVALTTAPMLSDLTDELARGTLGSGTVERKPAFFVMQPGHAADEARQALRARGIPYTDFPAEAIDALEAWARHGRQVAPEPPQRPAGLTSSAARALGPGTLDEAAAKALLAEYGVPVNRGTVVATAEQAAQVGAELGFPVVMKIVSPDIVHKSDVGGVAMGVADAHAARHTFDTLVARARAAVPSARIEGVSVQAQVSAELELIVGARRDPQFGPVLLLGAGGVLVELLPQRHLARAPMAASQVRQALQALPVWPVLDGYRGRRLAVQAVVEAVERLSWLAHDLGDHDFELDANPLRVNESGCCVVDARLLVR